MSRLFLGLNSILAVSRKRDIANDDIQITKSRKREKNYKKKEETEEEGEEEEKEEVRRCLLHYW